MGKTIITIMLKMSQIYLIKQQNREQQKYPKKKKESIINLIFTKEDGTFIGTDIIRYPYKVIHKELGIKNCRFYDLRGSFATISLRNGIKIREIADILGHSNVETTENYYISSSDETLKSAIKNFENNVQSDIINNIIKYK